jgi:hypothetical protein
MPSSRSLSSSERRVRVALLGILSLVLSSCRDIEPVNSVAAVTGYQFAGLLTTPDGAPVQGASVRVYFYYDTHTGPIDTIAVVVTDTTKAVDVSVYTVSYRFVRTLFFGYRHSGPVPRFIWNGLDEKAAQMPSGKYYIGYQVGDSLVKFSPVLLDGEISATTDGLGQFRLTNLPVGELFDVYHLDGSYDTTLSVAPAIDLVFQKQGRQVPYIDIPLLDNKITTGAFTF